MWIERGTSPRICPGPSFYLCLAHFLISATIADLKGAIRCTVEKQLRSLETQREQGFICASADLVCRVALVARSRCGHAPTRLAGDRKLAASAARSEVFIEGLQAIDWTLEERGLAGLSDLEGIPWTMPMEKFFEAWVEAVLRTVALKTGGNLKVARRRQTTSPLSWEPPYLGSQRSLVPDLILELEEMTLIVDAKYKRHWEELKESGWYGQDAIVREEHRQDLLQVLAYANLATTARVICCLVYPCSLTTWESLKQRGLTFYQAELPIRGAAGSKSG